MFLTSQLVITIFLLAAEKHKGTFLAPIGIGLSLFIAELSGVFFTGGKHITTNQRRPHAAPTHNLQVLSTLLGPSVHVSSYAPSPDTTGYTGWAQCLVHFSQ